MSEKPAPLVFQCVGRVAVLHLLPHVNGFGADEDELTDLSNRFADAFSASPATALIFDLCLLERLRSSELSVLLRITTRARDRGAYVLLTGVGPLVDEELKWARLYDVWTRVEPPKEALIHAARSTSPTAGPTPPA